MKTLITATLLSLLSFSAVAQDYACRGAYDKEIAKQEKNARIFGKRMFYGLLGGSIVESAFFSTTIIAGSLTVYTPVSIGFFVAGTGWMFYQSDKLQSHLDAKSAIEEAFTGKEELLDRAEGAYISVENYRAEKKLRKINKKLKREGKPELSLEDYLKENPIAEFNRDAVKTPLTEILGKLNKKRSTKLSYDDLSRLVQSQSQDMTFCPDGNAFGKRQMKSAIEKSLN